MESFRYNGIMRKNRLYFFGTALLITLVFCIPFYQSTVFTGLDLTFHLSRIQGILTSIADHQLPLAVYPDKNFGFGYASPLFYCDLFLIPASVLYSLHLPLVIVYKLYVFVIALLGSLAALKLMCHLSKDDKTAVFCTSLFVFSSYHINDFFIRAALGEAMAFSLLPLVILAMYRFLSEEKDNWQELCAVFSLLALSHLITFALSCGVFLILILVHADRVLKKQRLLSLGKAMASGFLVCAFFLLPLLQQMGSQTFQYERNRMLWGEEIMRTYSNTLLSAFSDYALVGYYDLELHHYFTGLTIVLSPLVYLLVRKKDRSRFMSASVLISMFLILATTDLLPLWKIPFLHSLQFTYRFNILSASLLPAVLAYSLERTDTKIRNLLIPAVSVFIAVNTAVIYHQLITDPAKTHNLADEKTLFTGEFYENYNNHYNIAELASGEYLPAAHHMDYEAMQSVYELFDTSGTIEANRHGSHTELTVYADADGFAALPVSWYLGYAAKKVTDDGEISVPAIRDEYTGRIIIPITSGEGHYEVFYKGTSLQKGSLLLSLLTLFLLLFSPLLLSRRKARRSSST